MWEERGGWDEGAGGDAAAAGGEAGFIDLGTIEEGFGRRLGDLLDDERWNRGLDPGELFRTARDQALRVVNQARDLREPLRRLIDTLAEHPDSPPYTGLHLVSVQDLESVARGYLYNGLTEAVCGDFLIHNTAPLAIAHAGVCLLGYDGQCNQWHLRLLRREMEINPLEDPLAAAAAILDMRDPLAVPQGAGQLQRLTQLARRGFVSYMERRVMDRHCANRWRIGSGVPVPFDMLTGGGSMDFLELSLDLLRQLLLDDPRWLFVAGRALDPSLATLGHALEPFEFAVLMRMRTRLREQVEPGHYTRHHLALADRFVEEVGPRIVLGMFRAGPLSPPRFFFAHERRVYTAALIAMADALHVEPHGIPALLLLAKLNCRASLGGEGFQQIIQQAYREAGAPEWFSRGDLH